jgi:hypothetical protein
MSNVSFARRTWFAATVGTCVPRWLLGTGLSHQSGTELPTVDAASLRAMKRRKDQAGQNALILDAASGIAIALLPQNAMMVGFSIRDPQSGCGFDVGGSAGRPGRGDEGRNNRNGDNDKNASEGHTPSHALGPVCSGTAEPV